MIFITPAAVTFTRPGEIEDQRVQYRPEHSKQFLGGTEIGRTRRDRSFRPGELSLLSTSYN